MDVIRSQCIPTVSYVLSLLNFATILKRLFFVSVVDVCAHIIPDVSNNFQIQRKM